MSHLDILTPDIASSERFEGIGFSRLVIFHSTDRKQHVKIDDTKSLVFTSNTGLPKAVFISFSFSVNTKSVSSTHPSLKNF